MRSPAAPHFFFEKNLLFLKLFLHLLRLTYKIIHKIKKLKAYEKVNLPRISNRSTGLHIM